MEADEPSDEDGKIVPLQKSHPPVKPQAAVNGKFVPGIATLSLPPLSGGPQFFPTEQKEYYRTVLREVLKLNGIGVQKLRDLIMAPEDAEASRRHQERGGVGSIEDKRLSYEDLKKWLSPRSTHNLRNDKFQFIDRFVLHALPFEWQVELDSLLFQARRKFHMAALKDIFQSKSVQKLLSTIPISNHLVFSARHGEVSSGYIFSLRGLDEGVGSLTVLANRSDSPTIEKESLRLIGRGYAVIGDFADHQFHGTAYIDRTAGGYFEGDGFMDRHLKSFFLFSIGPWNSGELGFWINSPVRQNLMRLGSEAQTLSSEELSVIRQFEKWQENV